VGLLESAPLLPVVEAQPAEELQRHQPAHPPVKKQFCADSADWETTNLTSCQAEEEMSLVILESHVCACMTEEIDL